MLSSIERWCALAPTVRWSVWCAALLLSTLPALFLNQTRLPLPSDDTRVQWARLLALRATTLSFSNPTSEAESVPFSALDYQRDGARLVSWLPNDSGGELIIDSDWQSIPALFATLSRSDMVVKSFSLLPQDGALHLTLRLGKNGAD